MTHTEVTSRQQKRRVAVKVSNGSLQLCFTACGKRHYLSLSLSDTPDNRKVAEAKATLIESDLAWDRFDPTLEKYRPQREKVPTSSPLTLSEVSLLELWQKYTEFKQSQIAETTLHVKYSHVGNHIKKLPKDVHSNAIAIRDYLLASVSPGVAKYLLTQFDACCKWATKSGLLDANPFEGLKADIKLLDASYDDIQPFSEVDKIAIIDVFSKHERWSVYAPFVKFLFMTGCRTGEAIALRWQHISIDWEINFCESVSTGLRIRKCTKTGKSRRFPCNEQLIGLLQSIKPENVQANIPVFTSPQGKEINSKNFLIRAWKPILEGLGIPYRSQYNTRHTFITDCLKRGVDVATLAKWVGNSPEIIYQHYAGTQDNTLPPLTAY